MGPQPRLLRHAEADALAAWRNGWFHTGDAFREDEDGYFYFVDRMRDTIRRRGENISSFEVEHAVGLHPGVRECAAVGMPTAYGDDEVFVAVIPADLIFDPVQLVADLSDEAAGVHGAALRARGGGPAAQRHYRAGAQDRNPRRRVARGCLRPRCDGLSGVTGTAERGTPPLDGVRVLDLGGGLAAAYTAKLLRDAGAEVIRVERPDAGRVRPGADE